MPYRFRIARQRQRFLWLISGLAGADAVEQLSGSRECMADGYLEAVDLKLSRFLGFEPDRSAFRLVWRNRVMQLALATWHEVEDYLQTSRGIIVPVGSTEQHGPNGLIGTDHLDAEFIAKGVGDEIGAMVAPTLAYGMSQHHLGFAGSVTLRPSTMIAMVGDIVRSLARNGFERFFFINGHGGNIATVTAAFDEVYASLSLRPNGEPSPIRCRMVMWSNGKRATAIAEELYPGVNGSHATAAEVSLAQFYHPEAIKHAQMTPKVAPSSTSFFDCFDYRKRYPDGRIGSDPSLSTPQHGERLFAAAVDDMIDAYRAFLA